MTHGNILRRRVVSVYYDEGSHVYLSTGRESCPPLNWKWVMFNSPTGSESCLPLTGSESCPPLQHEVSHVHFWTESESRPPLQQEISHVHLSNRKRVMSTFQRELSHVHLFDGKWVMSTFQLKVSQVHLLTLQEKVE